MAFTTKSINVYVFICVLCTFSFYAFPTPLGAAEIEPHPGALRAWGAINAFANDTAYPDTNFKKQENWQQAGDFWEPFINRCTDEFLVEAKKINRTASWMISCAAMSIFLKLKGPECHKCFGFFHAWRFCPSWVQEAIPTIPPSISHFVKRG